MVDMIYFKKHRTENGAIIAMCDSELIDKVLQEGAVEINLKDYSAFYKGELLTEVQAKALINPKEIFSANVVGSKSVEVAMKTTIIEKGHIKTINSVPYAQAFKVK
jgi:hypothetical protein